jgi:hypothetical protein
MVSDHKTSKCLSNEGAADAEFDEIAPGAER